MTPSADIVSFSCAAYNNDWGWEACREDIDQLMKRILETTGATDYRAFLSGSDNFRYRIYRDYKANRRDKPDPIFRADANAYLVTDYGATVTDGYEADDGIGIAATRFGSDAIICSIDKDLKQIPGNHYNWRKNEFTTVSPVDGLRSFWRSVLTGDRTDNISGVGGIGPVKSARIINDLESEWDMYEACKAMYRDEDQMHLNCQLLYILREENKYWEPPIGPTEETY